MPPSAHGLSTSTLARSAFSGVIQREPSSSATCPLIRVDVGQNQFGSSLGAQSGDAFADMADADQADRPAVQRRVAEYALAQKEEFPWHLLFLPVKRTASLSGLQRADHLGEGSVQLREAIRDLIGKGQKSILLNLGDVNCVESSGLGELVSLYTT